MQFEIPVILSADNNYAPYMSVTLVSILENADDDVFYDFYLLVPDNFMEEYKTLILKDSQKYKNNKINFINMQNAFASTKRMVAHISEQTYYRLKAANILPEKYDKCFYFDVDVVVNTGLRELFSTELDGYYIAAVKAAGYYFRKDWAERYCKRIGIPNIYQYINAGVLLMNLKKIREDNLTPVFEKEAYNNYPTVDQDIFNKICYNHILHLPFKYNVMTKYKSIVDSDLPEYKQMCEIYGENELIEAIATPKIVHYADKIKPWSNPSVILATLWWKYARKSVFFKLIIFKIIENRVILKGSFMLQKIFSVKNEDIHKVITVLGIKIKVKNRKLTERRQQENALCELNNNINQKLKRITPRPRLDRIGFHLVDHCNLNCKSCDVCSPIAEKRFVTLESFSNDIKRLAELTDGNIDTIILSGGEALLNPQILEMIRLSRQNFPNSIIRLQSNGILLIDKDEEFWKILKENDVTVVCTKYPIKLDYGEIERKAKEYKINFSYFNNANYIKTSYHIPFDLEGKQDPRDSFLNCFHANQCIGIHDGKIFTCSPAANAHHFNKYFNTDMKLDNSDYIDIYKAQSIQEILAFLARPIPFCKYCNVNQRSFNHKWEISKKDISEWIIKK